MSTSILSRAAEASLQSERTQQRRERPRAAKRVEKYSTANAARLRVMLRELRTAKAFLTESTPRTEATLDFAEEVEEGHTSSTIERRRLEQTQSDETRAREFAVQIKQSLTGVEKIREVDTELAQQTAPEPDEDFGDRLLREAENTDSALQALGKALMGAIREILDNPNIKRAPAVFEADIEAATLSIDTEFVSQKLGLHKSAVKLEMARQIYRDARQSQKAGHAAGSSDDDSSTTPRSDASTDSLDEAMRNHEPRRSRGNSTDSDDSDRSVAAGAVSDESKAIEALRARLKAAFTTSESLMAKYREILARKPQKTTELETKLYAKMRETISKTTKQADLGSRNLEEFDSAQLKELIDMTTVTNRQTRHNLTTMLDYLS